MRMLCTKNWFVRDELAFALNLPLAVSRLGIVMSRYASPILHEKAGSLILTFWIDDLYVLFSFACGFLPLLLDQYARTMGQDPEENEDAVSGCRSLGLKYWLIIFSLFTWHVSFDCFIRISSEFIQKRFLMSPDHIKHLNVL